MPNHSPFRGWDSCLVDALYSGNGRGSKAGHLISDMVDESFLTVDAILMLISVVLVKAGVSTRHC